MDSELPPILTSYHRSPFSVSLIIYFRWQLLSSCFVISVHSIFSLFSTAEGPIVPLTLVSIEYLVKCVSLLDRKMDTSGHSFTSTLLKASINALTPP